MSDITLWDAGRVKIYQDEKGNYGMRIYSENNVPFWDTATAIAEAQKKHIPERGRWTQQDIADADDLAYIMPNLVSIERANCERIGDIKLWVAEGGYVWISGALFPSLEVGEKVDIQDILGGVK